MLLDTDVLARLRDQAHTVASLASVLPATEEETEALLASLVRRGLVSNASGGYGDPRTYVPMYTLTPDGRLKYGALLDRATDELMGPPTMTVLDRFLSALLHDAPDALYRALLPLADQVSPDPGASRRRRQAISLGQSAAAWAQRALDADPRTAHTAAEGMRSLSLATAEDLGAAALQIQQSYLPRVERDDLRQALTYAAAALESVWELRLLYEPAPGAPLEERQIDARAYNDIADNAAHTLRALAAAVAVDPFVEARAAIQRAQGS